MIKTLSCTNGNFNIKNGSIFFIEDAEAISQETIRAAMVQIGDLAYSTNTGVDYVSLFQNPTNQQMELFKSQIVDAITSVNGVLTVSSINASIVGKVLSYTASYTTIFGSDTTNATIPIS